MKKLALAALLLASPAFAQNLPSPEGAEVYFISVDDGATVSSPVLIQFGLSGMGIAPAGHDQDATGHHHLLLNRAPFGESDLGDRELIVPVPSDENHLHFGGGQTEVSLDLPPGQHTMQLVLGDAAHVPHAPAVVSDYITTTVE